MSDQPEALRLADVVGDRWWRWKNNRRLNYKAAALMRRQHAEIERLYARQTDYEDAIASIKAECDALRVELQSVLDDWNALVKASGSPTNGGAIGHVRALRAECDALRELLSHAVRYGTGRVWFDAVSKYFAKVSAARKEKRDE